MSKKICFVDEDGRFGGPQQRMISLASELKKNDIIKICKKINNILK